MPPALPLPSVGQIRAGLVSPPWKMKHDPLTGHPKHPTAGPQASLWPRTGAEKTQERPPTHLRHHTLLPMGAGRAFNDSPKPLLLETRGQTLPQDTSTERFAANAGRDQTQPVSSRTEPQSQGQGDGVAGTGVPEAQALVSPCPHAAICPALFFGQEAD